MLVHIVDPSAYTPPYDHALCTALAAEGASVELYTSRFAYGPVAPARGYQRIEHFYRGAATIRAAAPRRALKLLEHVPDMLRYRARARGADIVHFQWLALQHLDGHLLPSRAAGAPPLLLTAHDILPREPRPGQRAAQRRLYDRFDAVVVHSEHGRARLTRELGVDADRVHVIAHGAFTHLLDTDADASVELPSSTDRTVVLCFGLIRPYKGIDLLLEAWGGVDGAELWVAGIPRMDIAELRRDAPAGVRFVPRYLTDAELGAYFRRADLVVLPYREIDQSGVAATALAFGKPLLMSDVGGFPELAAAGAGKTFPAGDVDALAAALRALVANPAALAELAGGAARAAAETYSWQAAARSTLALYERLLAERSGPGARSRPGAR